MKCLNCGSEVELHAASCPQCEVAIRWTGDEAEFLVEEYSVAVFAAYDPTSLPVIESLLLANDIPYIVNNELGQDVVGLGRVAGYNIALGPPVVTVPAAYEQAARELIASAESGPIGEGAASE